MKKICRTGQRWRSRFSDSERRKLSYNDQGQKRHLLTAKGRVIADELQLTDLARIQKQIWELEAEFKHHLGEFGTTLMQNTTELNDEFQRELTRRYD